MTSNLILWTRTCASYGKPTVQKPVDHASSFIARQTDAARGTCVPVVISALLKRLSEDKSGFVQNVHRQPTLMSDCFV